MSSTYPNEKFCIECAYHRCAPKAITNWNNEFQVIPGDYHICHSPTHGLNLVTKIPITPDCRFARSLAGKCGPQANLYKPSDPKE